MQLDQLNKYDHISQKFSEKSLVLPPQVLDPLLVQKKKKRPKRILNWPKLSPGMVVILSLQAENRVTGANITPLHNKKNETD